MKVDDNTVGNCQRSTRDYAIQAAQASPYPITKYYYMLLWEEWEVVTVRHDSVSQSCGAE
jgi:hypothetical protein